MANEPTMEMKNEAIALFMDVKPYEDSRYGRLYNSPVDGKSCFSLQYHTSWEWLMQVVEKIESIGGDIHIYFKYCHIDFKKGESAFEYHSTISKIEAVYKAVYQFIIWFNQQKQKDGEQAAKDI